MSGLISVADAVLAIDTFRPKPETETVPLEQALGRLISAPVIAQRTHPPAAMSAMDGYAVRLDDVRQEGARLRVIGEAPAGHPYEGKLQAGETVRVFTGSVVPDGADHIVIQENVTRMDNQIQVHQAADQPRHIRDAGIDFNRGDELIASGTRLGPTHLSVIAASNNATISAVRRLTVGLLSNGDELRPPGAELGPGEIINSNPYTLTALVEAWGGEVVNLGIAGDRREDIIARIKARPDIDVFVPIGGASVGDHDHMKDAFAALGFETVFSKVAVRPGKPTWFSKRDSSVVLGLPGNPASALVCAHLFLAPLLGVSWADRITTGRLTASVSKNGAREHFVRSQATLTTNGAISISPYANQDSSLLHPFLSCNALLRRIPGAPALGTGDPADVLLIGPLRSAE